MTNQEGKRTPEQTGKIKINNPYPFLLGDINAHVDRVLRDKGAATADVSNAIMTCPEPGIMTEWLESFASQSSELSRLREFKAYVHKRLDDAGIEIDPESPHKAAGCRIGGRLDIVLRTDTWLNDIVEELRHSFTEKDAEIERYREEIGKMNQEYNILKLNYDRMDAAHSITIEAKDKELTELRKDLYERQQMAGKMGIQLVEYAESNRELVEALTPFANLAEEVFRTKAHQVMPHQVLYQFNSAAVTYEQLSNANTALSKAKPTE